MQFNKRRATVLALLTSVALAAPAYAQDNTAPAQDNTVHGTEDIVVTAQKREENLQDVPISIQAISTQRLDNLNITNFQDYAQMLPSLSFQALGGTPGTNVVYMRGVASGGDGNHSGSLPSVGVYLDEQPVTTIGGNLDVHIYDIARIESLSGPQGTLYGASSEAGTVRIITNKPSTSGFSGRIDGEANVVSHGSYGGKLEGMINAPISGSAALRVVGFYQHDAGFIDNRPGVRAFCGGVNFNPDGTCSKDGIRVNNNAFVKDNYNTVDTYGGRAALKIDLDDNWTVTPTAIYQETRSKGSFGADPSLAGGIKVQHFFDEFRNDRFAQAALTIEGRIGTWDLTYAGAYLDRTTLSSSDYTDYSEAYDNLYSTVGGLAGYFYFTNAAGNKIDPRQRVVGSDHFKKMSQELRIASPADAPFRIVAGAFYQRQSNLIHQDYKVDNLAPAMSVNGLPGTLWLTQQHRVDKDYAAFGEASYDITPTLTLTAGGRLYKYDNSLIGFFGFGRNPAGPPYNAAGSSRTGVAGCFTTTGLSLRDNPGGTLLPAAVSGSPCTNLATFANGSLSPKSTEGDGFLYKLNLNWKPSKDVLLYGTWSRGYRPGGINRRGTLPPYAADFLTNYEIGWKTTLADGLLRFNGAVYQQDWSTFQFSFLGQNSFTEIHNGPNARIRGVEADINLASNGFSLTASGAYTDAKTTKNLCAADDPTYTCATGGNFISAPKGTRLPITPRFKVNATARYDFALGSIDAYIQGVVAHQSSASSDIRTAVIQAGTGNIVNPAALLGRLPAYTTVNFAFGGKLPGDLTMEVFLDNAFDERGQISRFQECGSCSQRPYAVYIRPMTAGFRIGKKF